MHREGFPNEQDLIDRYGKQEYIDELDKMIAMSPHRRLKFQGKSGYDEGGKCITRKLMREEGMIQLDEINVYTDETGVRSLQVILIHPDEELENPVQNLMYGKEPFIGEKKTYQFWNGDQLMGIETLVYSDF